MYHFNIIIIYYFFHTVKHLQKRFCTILQPMLLSFFSFYCSKIKWAVIINHPLLQSFFYMYLFQLFNLISSVIFFLHTSLYTSLTFTTPSATYRNICAGIPTPSSPKSLTVEVLAPQHISDRFRSFLINGFDVISLHIAQFPTLINGCGTP